MSLSSAKLWGLFFSSLTSATILPGSSEAVLTLLIHQGSSPLLCLLFASVGNWLGGMTGYFLGRLGMWSQIHYMGIKQSKIITWEKHVIKWRGVVAFFTWLPFIGDFLAVALGYFRINIISVSILMFIGKFIRYAVWIYCIQL